MKDKGYTWPQYFDGLQQESNKIAQKFGIDGIPHMFLVEEKGVLRFDGVRTTDRYRKKGDALGFQERISMLLAEN